MSEPSGDLWERWTQIFLVCRRQVERALEDHSTEAAAERGLAVVTTATMVEGYLAIREGYLPEHLGPLFRRLHVRARFRLLPRFCGVIDADYEGDPCHDVIRQVFKLRNQFVHANILKWTADTSRDALRELWNGTLRATIRLEKTGYRISGRRLRMFEEEVQRQLIGPPQKKSST